MVHSQLVLEAYEFQNQHWQQHDSPVSEDPAMASPKSNSLQSASIEQWQEAFMRHAVTIGGMEHDTALYEAAFAADDQADRSGADVGKWDSPTVVAAEVCAFWDRRLLSSEEAKSDADFVFSFDINGPSQPNQT